ncbi:MAG: hypothetical protein JW927_16360 [Deltaproteobacteria bacterium]|nr:hypothetical protein [Deltaproteobacteria bacterium]
MFAIIHVIKKYKFVSVSLLILLAVYSFLPACNKEKPLNASSVKVALIHFAPVYKEPDSNLSELLRLNRLAAEQGASIILNTEMAVSGYSFKSREDISGYTETEDGKTITAMIRLALEKGVYIGIALAERDPLTEIYYNSAFIIGPGGKVLSKYRKIISAEKRWANTGSPYQDGFADTPWGRIGAAICADSYSGLLVRSMALKDVDLLWVPTNWPESGGLNPVPIWRARALENGFYVAACNRTGIDLSMDCTKTTSAVFDPDGKTLLSGSSETSQVFYADILLNKEGKFAGIKRKEKMAQRNIEYYRNVYLRPWVEDLTGFYKLPETGIVHVFCYVPEMGDNYLKDIEAQVEKYTNTHPALWILPRINNLHMDENWFKEISIKYNIGLALTVDYPDLSTRALLITPDGVFQFNKDMGEKSETHEFPYNILYFGPAAIAIVPAEELAHPELAVNLSKLGADLVIVSEQNMTEEDYLVTRVKALDCMAVAACAANGAQITDIQDMHFNWEKRDLNHSGVLEYILDTSKTRKKTFYDAVDFDLLLSM